MLKQTESQRSRWEHQTQGCCSTAPLRIYNNLITSPGLTSSQNCNAQAYTINTNEFVLATIYNNIWWNFNSSECNAGAAGAGTYDYNGYYKVTAGKQDSGTHSYSQPSTDPFVNSSAFTVAGWALISNTPAGLTLSAPFNFDMLGVQRGSNGIWDIGALQISGIAPPVTDSESPSVTTF